MERSKLLICIFLDARKDSQKIISYCSIKTITKKCAFGRTRTVTAPSVEVVRSIDLSTEVKVVAGNPYGHHGACLILHSFHQNNWCYVEKGRMHAFGSMQALSTFHGLKSLNEIGEILRRLQRPRPHACIGPVRSSPIVHQCSRGDVAIIWAMFMSAWLMRRLPR